MFESYKLKKAKSNQESTFVNRRLIENKGRLLSLKCQIESDQREIQRLEERLKKIPEEIEFLKKLLKVTDERTQEYINNNGHDDFSNKLVDSDCRRGANITCLEEDLKNFPKFIKNLKAELFDLEKKYKKEKLKEKVYIATGEKEITA
jgi:hypothetical protein